MLNAVGFSSVMFYLLMVHHQATVVDLLVVIFFGWSYMSKKSTLELCLKWKTLKMPVLNILTPLLCIRLESI